MVGEVASQFVIPVFPQHQKVLAIDICSEPGDPHIWIILRNHVATAGQPFSAFELAVH